MREKVQKNVLILLPIFIQEQLFDLFTNALAPRKFKSFVSHLEMINTYHCQTCWRKLNYKGNEDQRTDVEKIKHVKRKHGDHQLLITHVIDT